MRHHSRWIVLVMFLAVGCAAPPARDIPIPASAPDMASAAAVVQHDATQELARDFTLKTLTGDSITLQGLRGQWVVLNFWATWCPPCVREMPYLAQLSTEREVTVLGVNVDETAAVAAKFAAEHTLPFPILMEPDDITLLVYGVRGLPLTVVIAPDGTIAHKVIGGINPTKFDARLDELGIGRKAGG